MPEEPNKPLLSNAANKALEKVLVGIMYTAIVGSAVYGFTRLQSIERNISKHHGVGWEEIKDIVQTSQIQLQVKTSQENFKNELIKQKGVIDSNIKNNTLELEKLNQRLEKIILWIEQGDKIMAKKQLEKYKGHAIYDNDGEDEKNCKVNYAHSNGKSFNVNDILKVNREESTKNESTTCKVVATIYDIKSPSVLLAVNKKMASRLGFTKEMGIITITTNFDKSSKAQIWKSINDF